MPGLIAEMEAAGAPTYRALEQLRWIINGRELARASTGMRAILASRPFIEGHVRRRVRGLRPSSSSSTAKRSGSRPAAGACGACETAEGVMPADLVVCATGRSAQVPAWIAELGFRAPREERIPLGLMYASRRLRLRPGALRGDHDRVRRRHAPTGRARSPYSRRRTAAGCSRSAATAPATGPRATTTASSRHGHRRAAGRGQQAIRDAEPLTATSATHGSRRPAAGATTACTRFPSGLLVRRRDLRLGQPALRPGHRARRHRSRRPRAPGRNAAPRVGARARAGSGGRGVRRAVECAGGVFDRRYRGGGRGAGAVACAHGDEQRRRKLPSAICRTATPGSRSGRPSIGTSAAVRSPATSPSSRSMSLTRWRTSGSKPPTARQMRVTMSE